MYVRFMLQYHGGKVFGQTINNPSKLANRVLNHIVVCIFGCPKFLCILLPVEEMEAYFLFDETKTILKSLEDAAAKVIVIISAGNRFN